MACCQAGGWRRLFKKARCGMLWQSPSLFTLAVVELCSLSVFSLLLSTCNGQAGRSERHILLPLRCVFLLVRQVDYTIHQPFLVAQVAPSEQALDATR